MLYAQIRLNAAAKAPKPVRMNFLLLIKTPPYKEKTREAVIKQLPDIEDKADMILDFIFSGMFAVYRNWFLSDRSQSIEEISGTLSELCFNGLNGVLALSAD